MTAIKNTIYPSFLDRLTDYYPKASKEGTLIAINNESFKKNVIRDLSWLLNTNIGIERKYFKNLPLAEESVLMFGINSFAGSDITDKLKNNIESEIYRAIVNFEPRIIPKSLSVRIIKQTNKSRKEENTYNKILLYISGDLWSVPIPEKISIKTEIDIETGNCTLTEN